MSLAAAARSRLGWLVVLAVIAAALAIGAARPVANGKAARIAALESQIKCPSCADLTIAQSDAAAAADLRAEVTRLVDRGASDAAVRRVVVAQFGASVLESPPACGVDALVWVVPTLVVVLAALVLGAFLWRRRRGPPPGERRAEDEALVAAARAGGS